MALLNYTTTVPVMRTVSQIHHLLVEAGARSIQTNWGDGHPVSLVFEVETALGPRSFRLPVNSGQVMDGQPVSPGPFICGAQGEQMLSGQGREDDRRARLYDALWKIAYQTGSVKLDVVGGHNIVFVVWVQGARLLRSGDLETIERQLVEYASGLG